MPLAFSQAGLILGLLSTLTIGSICTYCLHLLVKCQYELCKRKKIPSMSYADSLKEALLQGPHCLRIFSKVAVPTVYLLLVVYQLGICSMYVVCLSINIKKICDLHGFNLNVRIWMLILLVPLILMNFIRNLKVLAPFSKLANIITFIGIAILMYYIFDELPPLSSRDFVGSLGNYILSVRTVIFSFEAIGVIIALENNMKTPQAFGGYFGVLNRGMILIILLYSFLGFFGYLKYGQRCKGSVTLNLDISEILAQSVIVLFTLSIFISYSLHCYVPVDIILSLFFKTIKVNNIKEAMAIEYGMRTAIVVFTFLMAVAIPSLALFLSVFNALCLTSLGLIFPPLMHICIEWPNDQGKYWLIFWKDVLLVVFGFLGLVIGTTTSIIDIVRAFTVNTIIPQTDAI